MTKPAENSHYAAAFIASSAISRSGFSQSAASIRASSSAFVTLERLLGGGDGSVDIGDASSRYPADALTGARAQHIVVDTAKKIMPRAGPIFHEGKAGEFVSLRI